MLYSSQGAGSEDTSAPKVVGYVHHLPFHDVYLSGGMCVDPAVYRTLPDRLFAQIKQEGGVGTIIAKQSIAQLGDAPAASGHVGEKRARQSDLRAGFVDTHVPHLMVFLRKPLPPAQQQELIDRVATYGPF